LHNALSPQDLRDLLEKYDSLLTLHAGDMYLIPGNVPHSAVAGPEGFVAAEVFSPVREDLKYE